MKRSIIVLALGIVSLGLLGMVIRQYRQIQRLEELRDSRKAAVERFEASTPDSPKAAARETRIPFNPPVATQPQAPENEPAEVAPGTRTEPAAATNTSPMADIARMMKNPGMKDMMRAQMKGQQDMMYGSLFKYMQLPEEDMETFKSLLLDKQMALVDISMEMLGGATTPEDQARIADQIETATTEYNDRIRELLDDDTYALYQSYEATQPERMQVTLFKGGLKPDDQLTEEQEDKLIKAMHAERTGFKFSGLDITDQKNTDLSQLTPEKIETFFKESARLQERSALQAASILTPPQLEQFKASQKQQQAMQEMGLKMAAKMFGAKEPPAAPAKP
jgi:hypothetical protein